MQRTISRLAVFILSVGLCLGAPKLAKDLPAKGTEKVDVIIQFVDAPGAGDFASVRGQLKRNLPAVNGALFSMPVKALKGLANNPRIQYVSPDRKVGATLDDAAPTIGADIARYYGWNGYGVGIALLDSGVETRSSDIGNRVARQEDFTGQPYERDGHGHGTHVAGILAGSGYYSYGTHVGIAPSAHLVSLRVLDTQGRGTDSGVIAGIQRAIQLKNYYNIRVMNLSLGRPVFESFELDPLAQAVAAAWDAGIVVVVAAGNNGRDNTFGNEGYGTINAPGNHPLVITVGAMNMKSTGSKADDAIASYSAKGPTVIDHVVKPDIVAPGNRIVSTIDLYSHLDLSYSQNRVGSYYYRLSGTSMAAPMVSGAAALLLQQNPYLTPDQVKARLMRTASKDFPVSTSATDHVTGQVYGTDYDVFAVGAGYLDVYAALNDTETAPAGYAAYSPMVEFDENTGEVTMITDESLLWGRSLIWGRSAPWATSLIWGRSLVLEDLSLIWGRSLLWGRSLIWGRSGDPGATSLIWGRTSPWEDGGSQGEGIEVHSQSVLVQGEE